MSASPRLSVGPFRLECELARGGMGVVWFAEHCGSGTAVAVKVLTSRRAREPRFRADFRREVATLARLSHPNIIPILEHGVVRPSEAAASGGTLMVGAPYLVTEYARGGSLHARVGRLEWGEQEEVVRSVLCALGHAHARGVIHRDLKPGNVLLPSPQDAYPLVRLADFGVVHAEHQRELAEEVVTSAEQLHRPSGTPGYMSPEQFLGQWQRYGPWTDLYALGVLVWECVTGRLPYVGEAYGELAQQHLLDPLPGFEPLMDVPPGLERWLRRLLSKDPADRYGRARDAYRAFDEVCGAVASRFVAGTGAVPSARLALAPTVQCGLVETVADAPVQSDDAAPATPMPAAAQRLSPGTRAGREVQDSVSVPAPSLQDLQGVGRRLTRLVDLEGVGSSLLHLRVPPFVGREEEREVLWSGLQSSLATGEPRVVVVRGGVGVGKSRLSRWLCETAHEEGVANVLSVRAEPGDEAGSSLGRALGAVLHCEGLSGVLAQGQIRDWLHAHGGDADSDGRAVLELLLETGVVDRAGTESLPALSLSGTEERLALYFRVLGLLSRERALVLEVEDAHHDPSLVEMVSSLLKHPPSGGFPCLVVLTALSSMPSVPVSVVPQLDELASAHAERVVQVKLSPLPRERMLELVQDALGLKGPLAVEVADRSEGNPQLAVEVVRDLVRRRQLTEEGGELVLHGGGALAFPSSFRALARAPLDELKRISGVYALTVLELAAVLGHRFSERLWHRLIECVLPHVDRGPLLEEVMGSGVLEPEGERHWRFAHAAQRELLEEDCRGRYRWAKWNGIAAELLSGARGEQELLQLARHQEAAGRFGPAAESYLAAMKASVGRRDVSEVAQLLERLERVLDILKAPEGDERRLDGWQQVMKAGQWTWNTPLCRELALKTLALVDEEKQPGFAVEAYRALVFSQRRGKEDDYDTVEGWARKAVLLAELSGAATVIVRALSALATVLRETSRQEEAGDILDQAQQLVDNATIDAASAEYLKATILSKRAVLAHECGHYIEAEALFSKAAMAYDAIGARHRALKLRLNHLAAARETGLDPSIIESKMRDILQARKSISLSGWLSTQVNLGFALCLNEEFAEGLELLVECQSDLEKRASTRFRTIVTTFLLLALAGVGRVSAWLEEFERVESALEEPVMHHVEGATALEKAAELLAASGHLDHAHRSMRLAHLQWSALGHEGPARRCAARLEEWRRGTDDDVVRVRTALTDA